MLLGVRLIISYFLLICQCSSTNIVIDISVLIVFVIWKVINGKSDFLIPGVLLLSSKFFRKSLCG